MSDPLSEVIQRLQPRAVFSRAIEGAGDWAVRYGAFGQPVILAEDESFLSSRSNIHCDHAVAIREELLNGSSVSSSHLFQQVDQVFVRNWNDQPLLRNEGIVASGNKFWLVIDGSKEEQADLPVINGESTDKLIKFRVCHVF